MRVKETNKKEIEQKISAMNDYMMMEYLKTCLNNQIDFDTRKFVLVRLAGLYEAKGMFGEAGKAMRFAAEINTTPTMKISDYIKAAELFVRGGDYDASEIVVKRAMAVADTKGKSEIRRIITEHYKIQAKVCIEGSKRKQAVSLYERLLMLDLELNEKREVQESLSKLYGEIGDFAKQRNLQRKLSY